MIPEAIQRIANDSERQLAWHFFLFFSRFEYALKRQKLIQAKSKDARPAWKLFAKEHAAAFASTNDPRLKKAIEYFKCHPPKKQVHEDRKLRWADPEFFPGGPLLPWLLEQVQIVRNNLFHGGKFPEKAVPDPSRDRILIENSLVILGCSLRLNSHVEHSFYEGIDL